MYVLPINNRSNISTVIKISSPWRWVRRLAEFVAWLWSVRLITFSISFPNNSNSIFHYTSNTWHFPLLRANTWKNLLLLTLFSVGAVSIYLYDRYLKKKEVQDHEEQVKVNNTFTSNPLAADKPDETTHLNPSTTFDRSGQIDAQQDMTISNDPNTTQSESFFVPQDRPVPAMRQSGRQ